MTSKLNLENSVCIHCSCRCRPLNKSKRHTYKLLLETFEKLFPIDILILVCIQLREIFLWDQFLSDNKTSSAYIKLLILVVTSGRMFVQTSPNLFLVPLNTLRNMLYVLVQLKLELLI